MNTACHVYNHTPIKGKSWKTPCELWSGKKPDVHYFKTFGCAAWVYIPKDMRNDKLSGRSIKMIFISYDLGSKAYHFMTQDNTMFVSVKAVFNEYCFPCGALNQRSETLLFPKDND